MAKGQMKSNKEKKKPKKEDKPKSMSAYAQAYHSQPGGSSPIVKK